MPFSIGAVMVNLFQLMGNIIVSVYVTNIYVVFPIIFVIFLFTRIQKYYMKAQREIIRLESISKSPIISFFTESISGLSVIRAYQQEMKFFNQHINNVNENKKNQITKMAMNIFFTLFLSLFSILINATTILFCLLSSNTTPSDIGLLITYALTFDMIINRLILGSSELEGKMVNFERCLTYTQIEPENGYKNLLAIRENLKQ